MNTLHEVKGTHVTKPRKGEQIMNRVIHVHAGFMTYLLIAVLIFIVLCFVAPDIANEVLMNLHKLALAVKV